MNDTVSLHAKQGTKLRVVSLYAKHRFCTRLSGTNMETWIDYPLNQTVFFIQGWPWIKPRFCTKLILNWVSFCTGLSSRTNLNIFHWLFFTNLEGWLLFKWRSSRTKQRLTLIPLKEILTSLAINLDNYFLRKNNLLNRKKKSW